jgi:hypothetical protein
MFLLIKNAQKIFFDQYNVITDILVFANPNGRKLDTTLFVYTDNCSFFFPFGLARTITVLLV